MIGQVGSLDANAVLRFMLGDVPEQKALVVQLLRHTDGQFAVADVAIMEIVHALWRYYGIERSDIQQSLRAFMNLSQINCNRALFDGALEQYVLHPALSFEDCCLAVYAELNDAAPLYTFDKKLARQAPSAQLIA